MQLDAEQKQTEEKLKLLYEAREALSSQFKSLANDILEEKTKRFTEQNQTNLGQLLEPLKTKINEFQGKVEEVYVQEGKDRSALAQEVRQLMELNQSLSQEAKNLTSALKGSNKTQGSWGSWFWNASWRLLVLTPVAMMRVRIMKMMTMSKADTAYFVAHMLPYR
jgi:DNA recombination protein RmuC